MDAKTLLMSRRSIRYYKEKEVPETILKEIFELSKYAPSARNFQPSYLILIRDKKVIKLLGDIRGNSSAPISRAPLAVAICSDPSISKRYLQDGPIFAYHFMLSAWVFGIGTCWIADMDRDEVKEILNIPKSHYVVTVTPLGFPAENPEMGERKKIEEFVRTL